MLALNFLIIRNYFSLKQRNTLIEICQLDYYLEKISVNLNCVLVDFFHYALTKVHLTILLPVFVNKFSKN